MNRRGHKKVIRCPRESMFPCFRTVRRDKLNLELGADQLENSPQLLFQLRGRHADRRTELLGE